ncbi:putative tetratricopeptide-like helical domain superfamily [Helianthus annuus]|uniref:Putative tetratricopeptide-like helical domain-containing protein n=1 Tax=Helianthus annuus TaxID=4232 RepID=A0A251SM33_HELAN|nr:protein SLOW GREEN 1, chloroplastic [Helianthus annuus]KAF5801854.1 putative tetratricopeptide-like helical domain superfamily [Helianthus annuus]KAJ0560091.1 putative tetratricopeptide-like helical domain superfamily [Helianthus annuus]KAJ0566321.1 putative tetratricopeptide-like helical domain superfamily [Helianthus annuus]KAJ0573085.1 putative tetratricopeptide-like helical domain superfamily [Helianthus annuus]KAJ0740387.1 putative tetratricopeptide-like helical domain superfamily [Hel
MESAALSLTFHHPLSNPSNINLTKSNPLYPLLKPFKQPTIKTTTTVISAATKHNNNPITQTLKLTARTIVFAAAAAAVISKFQQCPAIAEPLTQTATTTISESESEISEFLESNSEAIDAMKTLLEKKLETGEDQESLKILKKLVLAQPENGDWKFLMERLLNETGENETGREDLEQILTRKPLSFEALFENAVLMDKCGEGEVVIKRLEKEVEEKNEKEARDVRLIIAQVEFLKKNVDEALKRYDELVSEDPDDFRPYFCKGMIYSLIDKSDEAKVEFAKYRELSPKKFEVEG